MEEILNAKIEVLDSFSDNSFNTIFVINEIEEDASSFFAEMIKQQRFDSPEEDFEFIYHQTKHKNTKKVIF